MQKFTWSGNDFVRSSRFASGAEHNTERFCATPLTVPLFHFIVLSSLSWPRVSVHGVIHSRLPPGGLFPVDSWPV